MSEDLLVEKKDGVAFLTLNRPKARNSLTRGLVAALTSALGDVSGDAAVRVVVLRGQGGHFCAGADLRATFAEDPELLNNLDAYMDAFHGLTRALIRCPKPTIASLGGAAVGFGADLALACDLRVASHEAYVQEKFVNIGLMPDGGGTFWLPRLVGTARALKAILLGDKLDAKELDALGLLVSLVAPADLEANTDALARRLAAGPPLALAAAKSAVYASLGDIENALRLEREGQLKLLRSQDCMEGIMAWGEKRAPNFQGR